MTENKNKNNQNFIAATANALPENLTKKQTYDEINKNITNLKNTIMSDIDKIKSKNLKQGDKLYENLLNLYNIVDTINKIGNSKLSIIDKAEKEIGQLLLKIDKNNTDLEKETKKIIEIGHKNAKLLEKRKVMNEIDNILSIDKQITKSLTNEEKEIYIKMNENWITLHEVIDPKLSKIKSTGLKLLEELNEKLLNLVKFVTILVEVDDHKMSTIEKIYKENIKLINKIEKSIIDLGEKTKEICKILYKNKELLEKLDN